MKDGQFCEGCPFANGVVEARNVVTRGYEMRAPNPGFHLSFSEDDAMTSETNRIRVVPPNNGFDSSWTQGTASEVTRRAEHCDEPVEVVEKRLGGLLGSRAVLRCGAFPDQNPAKIQMTARDTGWFDPLDFD
jgi:hypothetical protein